MLQAQSVNITIYNPDSTLTQEFITALCDAARTRSKIAGTNETHLERLINLAAGTAKGDSLQPVKTLRWHKKYYQQTHCKAFQKFQQGDFIRQAIQSDFREFANLIGPKNRLSLYLHASDPLDSLDMRGYINAERIRYEERYDNNRARFQKDNDWRRIMFYYFLFSEYKINYDD